MTWRAVTLNIWNREGPWEQRRELIRTQLLALDADVIGLQEVLAFPQLPSLADQLASGTPWHVAYAPAWNIGGGLSMGNAILSRHPLRDAQTLPLPSPAGLDSRSVAFARVETPQGLLPVFVTHFTVQPHLCDMRCQQARALADHVARLAPIDSALPSGVLRAPAEPGLAIGELPPIVMGDFNAEPDADEIRFLRGLTPLGGRSVYFADCWLASGAPGPGYTYDRRNPYALRSHEPSKRIDYIFVRGPDARFRGEPLSARLALDAPTGEVWPSDHFAVVAEISS